MLSSLPSIPYPPSGGGFWSPVTSTINWCEEDYYATIYLAEIVNAFTNLIFIYLAYIGISSCIKNRHPRVFLVAYISYLIIGSGSCLYHSSLKYPMQLLDELSMIYTTCVLFFVVFSHGQSKHRKIFLLLCIITLAIFITGYYHYIKDPLFHQNMFALLTIVVVFRSMYVMDKTLRPRSIGSRNAEDQDRMVRLNKEILRNMWTMIACGISSIAIGFLIWNLDNIYCSSLRRWRRELGLPWGILLEGHGWWHIFTGIAAYLNITYGLWLHYCRNGRQGEVHLVWPSIFGSIPVIERKSNTNNKTH